MISLTGATFCNLLLFLFPATIEFFVKTKNNQTDERNF